VDRARSGGEANLSVAFLFPGQGAQGGSFLDRLPDDAAVRETLAEASSILGRDVRDFATEDALKSTVAVQIATVVAGVAAVRALARRGIEPQAVAGLSVGTFTAAVACGAVRFADAVPLVRRRGELMERAYPHGYGLAAIVGLNERQVTALIESVSRSNAPVHLANLNSATQFVVAGADATLGALVADARRAGAQKAERLAVGVPSHSALLAHVADELEREIATVALAAPHVPYVTNTRGRATKDAEAVREDLARNVMYPVRWYDGTTALYELGARLFVKMPPGRILTELAEGAFPDARAVAVDDTRLDTIAILAERERQIDAVR